jgi:hypothetical protein
METSINTIHGLETYFFDDVFYAHPKAYPEKMTREQFEDSLEDYREGMNLCNECKFPSPSTRTINHMYRKYQDELSRMPWGWRGMSM